MLLNPMKKRKNRFERMVMRGPLLPISIVLIILFTIGGIMLRQSYQDNLNERLSGLNPAIVTEFELKLKHHADVMSIFMDYFKQDRNLIQGLAAKDDGRLLSDWQPLFKTLHQAHGISHFSFFDPGRVCLLRFHDPERNKDLVDRQTLVDAERSGETVSGLEVDSMGLLSLRMVVPVYEGKSLIGYVELGKEIHNILNERNIRPDCHLAVTVNKTEMNKRQWKKTMQALGRDDDWDLLPDSVVNYTSISSKLPYEFAAALKSDKKDYGSGSAKGVDVRFAGRDWRCYVIPLPGTFGKNIGELAIFSDITADKKKFNHQMLLAGVFGGVLTAGLLGFPAARRRLTDKSIPARQEELARSHDRLLTVMDALDSIP